MLSNNRYNRFGYKVHWNAIGKFSEKLPKSVHLDWIQYKEKSLRWMEEKDPAKPFVLSVVLGIGLAGLVEAFFFLTRLPQDVHG